jgi:hypothetical protein
MYQIQNHLKTYGYCQRSNNLTKLTELASYIKGTARPEILTKGASSLSLVKSTPRFDKVEREK